MSLPPYDQSVRDFERYFQVVLPDSVGQATIGFRDGVWYRLNSGSPHPVPIRSAIILCPHAAGSIVQIACWWMRENTRAPRALDLATELALTVGELARKAIEDDPLGMSLTTLPQAPSQSSSTPLGASSLGSASLGSSSSSLAGGSYDSSSYSGSYSGSYGNSYGGGSYDSGSYNSAPYAAEPYPAAPPPAPSPYEPAYSAATTLLPQITPNMPAPDMTSTGRSFGGAQRPSGPMPGLPALPPPAPGRPAQAPPGFGPARGQGGAMPGGRPPMGPPPGQSGAWDRPGGFEPGRGRPSGGPPPRQPGNENIDPRGELRGGPPAPRRPERDEYNGNGRPAQGRPGGGRPDPGRAW
ncbi:hypothetical protein KGA66_09380 [Actinocrinis puniceicyclus]|uniref:Uncharacterized protein n=1 Tax=Actinocrinis puniceicyclus TaxID=977794 RepID=A0A8J7WPP1_9ACTN|nr:hypothetical protein [Actinocrinis puniceicyclus]MBS2963255.1 hypothetical protein [Actinocrinis puniceicyclus]